MGVLSLTDPPPSFEDRTLKVESQVLARGPEMGNNSSRIHRAPFPVFVSFGDTHS